MELYITDLGTMIKKRDDLFEITTSEKKVAVAPQKIKSLVLAKGIFLTTDVIKLAVENNIDIVIVDDFGNPYGRFWQSKFGSTANIRRKQLEGILEYLESLNHEIKIKLTNNQEIIVFNLNGEETLHILRNFEERLIRSAFEDTITCTGVPRCRLAITSSKSAFDKILKKFDNNDATLKKELPQLRMSGCPNSCSLTFKGDLGFSGRIKKIDEKVNIAYTLLSENKNIKYLQAYILEENIASKKIFENLGFIYDDKKEICNDRLEYLIFIKQL